MLIAVPADLGKLINVAEYIYTSNSFIIAIINRSFIIVKFFCGRLQDVIWVFQYFGFFSKIWSQNMILGKKNEILKKHNIYVFDLPQQNPTMMKVLVISFLMILQTKMLLKNVYIRFKTKRRKLHFKEILFLAKSMFSKKIWFCFIIFKYVLDNSKKNTMNFHFTELKLCRLNISLNYVTNLFSTKILRYLCNFVKGKCNKCLFHFHFSGKL